MPRRTSTRLILQVLAAAVAAAAETPAQGPGPFSFNPAQNPPFAVVNPNGPPPDGTVTVAPGPRYTLDAAHQDVRALIKALAKKSGKPISILNLPLQLVTVSFENLPFDKALAHVLAAGGLDFRMVDGVCVVGQSVDLRLQYPQATDGELDATYRCRRVGAATLASTLTNLLPGIRAFPGPLFLSPELKDSSGADTQGGQVKTFGATDTSYRTHDVVISGPADLVRRALTLAQKFDRSRRMVRLKVKIITINESAKKNLGVNWMDVVSLAATERPNVDALGFPLKEGGNATGALVDGIRMGKFAHAPLTISATLHVLEQKGLAKTLSNPTLMILDGERSFILDGEKYYYPEFKSRDQNGQAIFGAAEMKIGVYLQVSVQVGTDNDMILTLYPQVTTIAGYTTINGANVPNVFTSEEQTTVRATSGEVLVLGGLTRERTGSDRNGLPFLSRIPLLGRLFSSSTKESVKSELMIILTPELVEEPAPKTDMIFTASDAHGAPPAPAGAGEPPAASTDGRQLP
ncbi:type II secretion system protein GspD [Mesoterricola silvestris]|uniref:Type II/III secretion system secretin-like domain-containing protein n=1 Tax=Mesoterricola silvestris TaxID=2927979 RepID=A0AA48GTG2_9BACT|nr:hypothetical protein [Mesoterricola silvestris]BDU74025.1 hypothetical protein METEAL_31990 [Mesoterricola silvestris]